jgi:NTE family protein
MAGLNIDKLRANAAAYELKVLVLQGGGALGSYQGGVYEGLAEAGIHPSWVAGISIGALNAAIIAGNPPERRVEQLRAFWELICQPPWLPSLKVDGWQDPGHWPSLMRGWMNGFEASRALIEGQKGFFIPRALPGSGPAEASFYDTTPLRATLERFCDFDRINDAREMRVSVGAVNVRTGNFIYFDNRKEILRPEHFMASGALPPGFPAVEVDGEFYWDGGLISNTPLFQVLTEQPRRDALIFQVDLWSATGALPDDLWQVANRQKDIQFSSRTRMVTDEMQEQQQMRRMLKELLALVPPGKRDSIWYERAADLACEAKHNVVHLIYRDKPYESNNKDFQFGTLTMRDHWSSGLGDIRHTFEYPSLLAMPPEDDVFVTHDIHRGADGDD